MPPQKIKPVILDWTLVVDSREQNPYVFEGLWDGPTGRSAKIVVPTLRKALPVGDYSIEGLTDVVTIERKSKSDLWSSISQNRENFVRRLENMESYSFAAVVIEAGWDDLLQPPPFTEFSPKSLSRTIQSWILRYRTRWLLMPDRAYAEAITFRLLQRFWIHQQEAIRNEHTR